MPSHPSPSAGLKFADLPNGLAAISKVPALGWSGYWLGEAIVLLARRSSASLDSEESDFVAAVPRPHRPARHASPSPPLGGGWRPEHLGSLLDEGVWRAGLGERAGRE